MAAAKRVLRGVVGTDGEAGPAEVAIIADDTADPRFVAADLIAQAEHDELAACLLVTTDATLAENVAAELTRQVPAARHRERVEKALNGQSACVIVDDLDAALAVSDAWAPEHLEVQTEDAAKLAARRSATRARSSRARTGRCPSATTGRIEPRAADRRDRQAHQRALGVPLPPAGQRDRVRPRDPGRRRAVVDALGGAEDLAAHVQAVRVRVPSQGGEP